MDQKTILVPGNPIPGTIGTVVRYLLTILGTMLLAKEVLPTGTDIDQVVGAAMMVGSLVYGVIKTKRNHNIKVALADKLPDYEAKVT